MNMKMKALVAVTAMAMGAQAQAAINSDVALSPTSGTGAGELFLSVIDRGGAAPKSYVLDLGITAAQFLAGDASYLNNISIAADSNLSNFLSTKTGTIAWNIAAVHNDATNPDNFGFLSTSSTVPVANGNTVQGFGGIGGAMSQMGQYLDAVNQLQAPGQTTNYAVNNSVVISSPSDNAFYDGPFWGDTWTLATMSTEAGTNSALGFYMVAMDYTNDPSTNSSRVQSFMGNWSLSNTGTLTYTGATPPPAVPVPAAVWLLGSALVGLVGVARRKTQGEQA